MTQAQLRVVSGVMAGLSSVRAWRPDLVLVQDGPWRLRWRTPLASLANGLGLFYAAGGGPSAGTAVLVSLRAQVGEAEPIRFPQVAGRPLRGAVLVPVRVGDTRLVLCSARLADDPAERASQAQILAKTLADVTDPLILGGWLDERPDGPTATLLSAGRTVAGDSDGGVILVGAGVRVDAFQVGAGPQAPIAADVTVGSPLS